MPILGIIASSFRSAAGPVGAYDALATVTVPSGGVSSISFVGIPQGYKHLQIRGIVAGTGNSAEWLNVNLNGTTSARSHALYGTGSAAGAQSVANSFIGLAITQLAAGASIFGAFIVDVLDYADTNKNKTVRGLAGREQNGYGTSYVTLGSSLYNSTTAVSSLTITPESASFAQYSQFALYGIK
jgi:hypothetical protein